MLGRLAAIAALLIAAPAAAPVQPVAIPCERACMEHLADQFLAAMAACHASTLPLSPDWQR